MANIALCVIASIILILSPLSQMNVAESGNDVTAASNHESALHHQETYILWGIGINAALTLVTGVIAVFAVIQARASRRSADALVASERAWVDGELIRTPVFLGPHYQLRVFNRGKTPAHIYSYEIQYGCCIEEDYIEPSKSVGGSSYRAHSLLGSNEESTLKDLVYLDTMSKTCERWGVCRVTILYADVIMPEKTHQTYFIYRYDKLTAGIERMTFPDSYK
jgi:hypothetical protein